MAKREVTISISPKALDSWICSESDTYQKTGSIISANVLDMIIGHRAAIKFDPRRKNILILSAMNEQLSWRLMGFEKEVRQWERIIGRLSNVFVLED